MYFSEPFSVGTIASKVAISRFFSSLIYPDLNAVLYEFLPRTERVGAEEEALEITVPLTSPMGRLRPSKGNRLA